MDEKYINSSESKAYNLVCDLSGIRMVKVIWKSNK